jgi:hypothetical protein
MGEPMNTLEWLLDYELKQSVRHRRYLSLVILSPDKDSKKLKKVLEDSFRCTDPVFSVNGTLVVLMGETDKNGAVRAVERYQKTVNGSMDVRYSVASFPEDAKEAEKLMHAAYRRLETARTSRTETVVIQG